MKKPTKVNLPPLHTVPPNDWLHPNAECIQVVWNPIGRRADFLASDGQLWVSLPASAIESVAVKVNLKKKDLPKLINKRVWRYLQDASSVAFNANGIDAVMSDWSETEFHYNYSKPQPEKVNWYDETIRGLSIGLSEPVEHVIINAHLLGRAQRCVSPFSRDVKLFFNRRSGAIAVHPRDWLGSKGGRAYIVGGLS